MSTVRLQASSYRRVSADEASEELRALMREVAEMAWQRLEYFPALARAEAEKVKRDLREARRGSLAAPPSPGPMGSAASRGSTASPGYVFPEGEGVTTLFCSGGLPRPDSLGRPPSLNINESGAPFQGRLRAPLQKAERARELAEQLLEAFEPDLTRWRGRLRLEQKLEAIFRRLLEKKSSVVS